MRNIMRSMRLSSGPQNRRRSRPRCAFKTFRKKPILPVCLGLLLPSIFCPLSVLGPWCLPRSTCLSAISYHLWRVLLPLCGVVEPALLTVLAVDDRCKLQSSIIAEDHRVLTLPCSSVPPTSPSSCRSEPWATNQSSSGFITRESHPQSHHHHHHHCFTAAR